MAILEFIHCIVETLDRYFSNVCELDIMYNLETVRQCVCLVGSLALRSSGGHHRVLFGETGIDAPTMEYSKNLVLLPFYLAQTHYILDEMCMNGCIVETNRNTALAPIHLLEKAT